MTLLNNIDEIDEPEYDTISNTDGLRCWLAARTREAYKPRYRQAGARERGIYKALLYGMVTLQKKFELPFPAELDELFGIFQKCLRDNPVCFYIKCLNGIKYQNRTEAELEYQYSEEEMIRYASVIDKTLVRLRRECREKSYHEKELAVHNSLVKQVVYDLTDDLPVHLAHSAFVYQKAVCDGISKAAALMFGALGMESCVVSGDAYTPDYKPGDKTAHAWNMVRYGREFYHLDITFDNSLAKDSEHYCYDYFNLTDAQISKDHKWDEPRIVSGKNSADYYTLTGRTVSSADELTGLLRRGIGNREEFIRFKLTEELSNAGNDELISILRKSVGDAGFVGKFNYSVNEGIPSCAVQLCPEE